MLKLVEKEPTIMGICNSKDQKFQSIKQNCTFGYRLRSIPFHVQCTCCSCDKCSYTTCSSARLRQHVTWPSSLSFCSSKTSSWTRRSGSLLSALMSRTISSSFKPGKWDYKYRTSKHFIIFQRHTSFIRRSQKALKYQTT